jgi:hypothetical protein
MTQQFKTTLSWDDGDGREYQVPVTVTYRAYPGYAGSQTEPPEGTSVTITDIQAAPEDDSIISDAWFDDEGLIAECMADWRDDQIAAAEYRAEARADDRMQERWEREA